MLGTEGLVLVGTQQYILRMLSLVVFVFVYGRTGGSSCYCLYCSFVASVSILPKVFMATLLVIRVVVVVVVRFVSFERW